MTGGAPDRGLLGQIRTRIVSWFLLKVVGITAFIWGFFLIYFHLLRHPAYPVYEMPLTAVDRWLPFQPAALGAYMSLWFYVGLPPGLLRSFRALISYGLWALLLCLGGLLFFYYVPTTTPAYTGPGTDGSMYAVLKGLDASGNACPSLHVAAAVFTGCWLDRLLRTMAAPRWPRALLLAWCVAIVYSTLAVKQHVLLDVLAGAAWGGIVAVASMRWSAARLDCVPVKEGR
ncbi:MAG TPA: phosphatase PAP2 family protein [Burkholderiaceae bacterium]|nr:phosphatase PAP2 family protein [Burkholderiaceae bacterium]HMY98768.1 phosphatase PAP2 family protein [Burkholderiaceae bacterium]HNB44797.1 phosphatase PAP2 family protein [Burkholderiaceae bacterium]HNG78271.1 phosphatase PAP2 family protein [Burkholderiaceae bacterium]